MDVTQLTERFRQNWPSQPVLVLCEFFLALLTLSHCHCYQQEHREQAFLPGRGRPGCAAIYCISLQCKLVGGDEIRIPCPCVYLFFFLTGNTQQSKPTAGSLYGPQPCLTEQDHWRDDFVSRWFFFCIFYLEWLVHTFDYVYKTQNSTKQYLSE